MKKILLIGICCLFLSGCGVFHAYQADRQQGNVIDSTTAQRVRIGMSQQQAVALLGEPVLQNTFDSNQLLYVYNFIPNRGKPVKKRMVLTFSNNKLVKIKK